MTTYAPSTVRVKRLRERRSRGVAMVAQVEVGEGGAALLVSSGLLKEHETRDRKAVGEALNPMLYDRPRNSPPAGTGCTGMSTSQTLTSKIEPVFFPFLLPQDCRHSFRMAYR